MIVVALSQELIQQARDLMELGAPYVRVRTQSDYWLYANLFSSSCPVALVDNTVVGAVIAFRSQDKPDDFYVQDVMTHPEHRNCGIARTLLGRFVDRRQSGVAFDCILLLNPRTPPRTPRGYRWVSQIFRATAPLPEFR